MSVKLYAWNPRRPVIPGRLGKIVPLRRKVNNFGDLLGPQIVRKVLSMRGMHPSEARHNATLMSVGSVMHFAPPGAVVWGTGINGKVKSETGAFASLDVRAVRGPLTRDKLRDHGIDAPAIYGDPALLYSYLWRDRKVPTGSRIGRPIFIPNLNDYRAGISVPDNIKVVLPTEKLRTIVREIEGADMVIGSSLHAIVLAESIGVPARCVVSTQESAFKYNDYFAGTGRNEYQLAHSVGDAMRMGGENPPVWDPGMLLNAFPWDLWGNPPARPSAEGLSGKGRNTNGRRLR